jgi:site-specific recombinase XerD
LKREELELNEVGTTELAEFLSERKSESLSASSLRLATVHLKIFFRWLLAKKMISMDPAEPLVSSKSDRKLPATLSPVIVEGWLESIPTDVLLGKRDKAILELF